MISRAIAAREPRTRYTDGPDAAMVVPLSQIVPDRFLDRVPRRQMKST